MDNSRRGRTVLWMCRWIDSSMSGPTLAARRSSACLLAFAWLAFSRVRSERTRSTCKGRQRENAGSSIAILHTCEVTWAPCSRNSDCSSAKRSGEAIGESRGAIGCGLGE